MPTVVGVKLRHALKVFTFDAAGVDSETGDAVVVRTERGEELGEVVSAPHEAVEGEVVAELKPVLRVATDHDRQIAEQLCEQEREAMPVYRDLVKEHDLDMKPIDVEYMFDGSKAVFYFVAEERVDFRELVRDLAARFKTRIDMRQIGVRDEARLIGGIGHCGEQLCCVRFGGDFQPVSIRMAKEQDLPLNPLKISGLCGRLMCCLRYEYEAYKEFKSRAPRRGATVETPMGEGKVTELNTPRETVTIRIDGRSITVPVSKMDCRTGEGCPCSVSEETLIDLKIRSLESALSSATEEPRSESAAVEPAGAQPARKRPSRRRGKSGGATRSSSQGSQPQGDTADETAKETKTMPGRRRRRRRSASGNTDQAAQAADGKPT